MLTDLKRRRGARAGTRAHIPADKELADILAARVRLDLSASDIAKALGVAPRTMAAWLSGKRRPPPADMDRIREYVAHRQQCA
jgi:DNA-binding transcriptional regulator YiaG